MARARVPASLLRRLDAMVDEDTGVAKQPGVMRVPPIMGLDAWEELAMRLQQEAFEKAREDRERADEPKVDFDTMPEAVFRHAYSLQSGEVTSRVVGTRPPLPPTSVR